MKELIQEYTIKLRNSEPYYCNFNESHIGSAIVKFQIRQDSSEGEYVKTLQCNDANIAVIFFNVRRNMGVQCNDITLASNGDKWKITTSVMITNTKDNEERDWYISIWKEEKNDR